MPVQLNQSIVINDNEAVSVNDILIAPPGAPVVDIVGDNSNLSVSADGAISAPDVDNTGVSSSGDNVLFSNAGSIFGAFNGVSSTGNSLNLTNFGVISSDSRAIDITDGDGVRVQNFGTILGTGNQRNGTLYVDGTVDDLSLQNFRNAVIDAGEGNLGDAVSVQVGAEGDSGNENINITNAGVLQGRGDGLDVFDAGARLTGNGSSGLRFFNGIGPVEVSLTGNVTNRGTITAEVNVGFLGGLVVEDGVAFDGQIVNERNGIISGPRNGLYIGNAEHDLAIVNRGRIESGSRAVNIDGTGVSLLNSGQIIGTADQRNGTIYSDATADEYSIVNGRQGLVDAGEGNQGAGIALQTGEVSGDVVNATFRNVGTIQGRGQAPADSSLAGDGLRIFSGVVEGGTIYRGNINNSGNILSESAQGATSAVRFSDGLAYEGRFINTRQGNIAGVQNGLYFGNADHSATVINQGTISSDSRAVNIDGTGVDLVNFGRILGTDIQRNGTIYSDATADNYSVVNRRQGLIDAGRNNQGAGISLQTGDVAGDVVTASVRNDGRIFGRGDAPADTNQAGDGIRLFAGAEGGVTFEGDINNRGLIDATQRGISIQTGVTLDGEINNSGTIRGDVSAIDAQDAAAGITVNNSGRLIGDVLLSDSNDVFNGTDGIARGSINGLEGDDLLLGGRRADVLIGGVGDDTLTGGRGRDRFVFAPEDFGADVVTDFQGRDVLDVSAFNFGVSDLNDVISNAQQIGQDTLLTLTENNTVLLQGLGGNTLGQNNFIA